MNRQKEQLSARIRRCAQLAGSGDALARKSGIPRRTLETYLTGRAEPKASRLAAIAQAAGVSAHWLVTGEGPMREDLQSANDSALIPALRIEDDTFDALGVREIPATYQLNDLAFRRRWLESRGLPTRFLATYSVRGDAMAPTIEAGDLLLVALRRTTGEVQLPEEGIHLIRLDGHIQVKRLQSDGHGGLLIKSDNPSYETVQLDQAHLKSLEVLGRVLWRGRTIA